MRVASFVSLAFSLACSSTDSGVPDGASGGAVGSGGQDAASGGASQGASGGASAGTGGTSSGTGGAENLGTGGGLVVPVDCSLITAAGFEVCETTLDSCGAVFTDSSGCSAVCAAAGLECETAYEDLGDICGADNSLPAISCESGHQSDYCLCRGGRSAGTGGSPGTGGESASGGSPGTGGQSSGAADCNTVTNQPIVRVAQSGSADHATVQAAINSISKSNTTLTIIRIAPGTYTEKLIVDRPNITLCGEVGQTENTVLVYGDGGDTVGTSGSASVNISSDDVSGENLTIKNSRGQGTQAVAALISGKRVQFRNSRFIGFQDTLYVRGGPLYFRDCHIEGTVDFIFGDATAVFDECTIHNVDGGSAVTAPSTDQNNPYGIVFLGGKLTASGNVKTGSIALGRNWRPYGSTTYIQTELGAHISSVGWVKMGDNSLSTARFSEYQTTGPGANAGARAPESSQLSAGEAEDFSLGNILGSWTPSFSE